MMIRLTGPKLFLIVFLSGILILPGCRFSDNNIPSLESITKKWIPDGREALCTIKVEKLKNGNLVLHGETNIQQLKNEAVEYLKNSGFNVTDSVIVLPDTTKNNQYRGIATLSVINLRKHPDHASELVSQAILGTPVIVLKNVDSWILVQTPDKYISWTEESSVRLMTEDEFNNWRSAEKVIYLQNAGWIYSSPQESAVVGDIVSGCILRKIEKSGDYTKIEFPDGREGFLRNNEIMNFESWKEKSNISGDDICAVASKFIGSPYMWGGSSAKAVDCSGFVQSVFFMNGLILSRDASLQARHGKSIDISNGFDQLMKGDLLFFGWKKDSVAHVVHVAIYNGDQEYMHSSGRVTINSLDPASAIFDIDRKNSLLSARRILGTENDNGIVPVKKHGWY